MDANARSALEDEMGQLKHEWNDVARDFEDIGRRYRKPTSLADSGMSNGTSSHDWDGRSESPETGHRSRIIIRRGGLIRRIDADPSADESDNATHEGDEVWEAGQTGQPTPANDGQLTETSNGNDGGTESSGEKDGGAQEEVTDVSKSSKSPWQELWDSLAEYAGMHNHYED